MWSRQGEVVVEHIQERLAVRQLVRGPHVVGVIVRGDVDALYRFRRMGEHELALGRCGTWLMLALLRQPPPSHCL